MKLRTRIGSMFATGFGVIVLGAVLSWCGVTGVLDATREVRTIHERLETFDGLLGDLVDVETSARGFAISGQAWFLEPYGRAAERLPERLRRTTELANRDPVDLARTLALLAVEADRLVHASEVVRARREHGAEAAEALVAGGRGQKLMNQARGMLAELRATEAARLADLTARGERKARLAFELILGSAVAMALAIVICTLVLARSITRPIGALARAAIRISRGEWPAIKRERDDEIGELADSLAAMAHARRQAETRVRVLIDHAPDAFLVADHQGRYIDVNLAATALLGYERDELLEMTVTDLIPAEDLPRLAGVRRRLLVAGTVDLSEWSLLRKDGTRVPVEVSAKILGDGRWQAFVRDISERKRAQEERERLLLSEREHRRRLQAIRQAVLAISPLTTSSSAKTEEVLRSILEQARQLTGADFAGLSVSVRTATPIDSWVWSGLTDAEAEAFGARPLPGADLAGASATDRLLSPDRVQEADELSGTPPRHPAVGALLTMPIRRNGTAIGNLYLAKRCGAAPFTTDDRALVELLVMHAAVAIENAKLYDEVHAAVAAREDLLAMVSHDLRNPLNAILLREDLLGRKRAGDRELTEHARWVRRSIGNMHRMIQGLLDAASLEAGHLVLDLEANDFRAVVDEVLDALGPLAAEAGVGLECRVPEGHLARFDRERLAQVVYNLVGNAVKFTPRGGRVTLSAAGSTSERLEVAVSDSGRGIAPDVLPHVFERYFTTEPGRRGTGLGLHIAEGIVHAHGGKIWATSVLGEGATFHFTVPMHAASNAAPERPDPERLEGAPAAV